MTMFVKEPFSVLNPECHSTLVTWGTIGNDKKTGILTGYNQDGNAIVSCDNATYFVPWWAILEVSRAK